jgi:DNA topoisomerase-1
MNLVIVESPAKGKTIEKYLGKDYKVLASFGHVRDLPKKTLGVDVKNNFEPTYEIPDKAKKTIKLLKSEIAKADTLYLATDYDREGEAIAYHIIEAIKPKKPYKRITFHEITKPAITESIKHPRDIDLNLVDAQQARRVLDRLVGYKLSPFLWRKVAQGLSAGRVQSVAVRLVVEREQEIQKFNPEEYWSIEALLEKQGKEFKAILTEIDGKKVAKMDIKKGDEAQKILSDLDKAKYEVNDLSSAEKMRYPSPPFTTSTLQQDAGNKLGYSAKQIMRLAQNLYEDGLITYMRTDSLNVSRIALDEAEKVISDKFGKEYSLDTPRFYKTKSRGAQEAHEAIRPTSLKLQEVNTLTPQHQKLYSLIWKRMIASQMKEARLQETTAKISAGKYILTAKGLKTTFPGFMKVYKVEDVEENMLPELKIDDIITKKKLEKLQHFTEPPARFSEGSLIKELEKLGIGRPSTYAPTLSTIQDRGYVEKVEGRFIPKDIGTAVNDLLVEHFPEVVDYDFTAKMEEELDEVAEGKLKWQPVIKEFYGPFSKNLTEKNKTVTKNNLSEETDEICPKCGKKLMLKLGRFGKFLACQGFPECKFTKPYDDGNGGGVSKEVKTDEKCPKCSKGLVLKESRYGQFFACEGYPECKYTKTIEVKAAAKCPACGGDIVRRMTKKRRAFWGCSNYPKCKTAFWTEPVKEKCPKCGSLMVKSGKNKIKCSKCK